VKYTPFPTIFPLERPETWRDMANLRYAEIVQQTNRILSEYEYPLTLRQVYYRLVSQNTIPNTKSAYNSLSKMLVKAREVEDIDEERIEDRARQAIESRAGYPSPSVFVQTMKAWFENSWQRYSLDLWTSQSFFVEIWVEKDALSSVFAHIAAPFRVTVCPSRGYASYTYIKRMAVDHRFSKAKARPIVILHFADHDPSGLNMTDDLRKRFSKYSLDKIVTVKRIALTIEQIREYDLQPNPVKRADPRAEKYRRQFGDKCWELDAMEPKDLQRTVEEALNQHIDKKSWEKGLARERKDKNKLQSLFESAEIKL
jgi:hypothetical protein